VKTFLIRYAKATADFIGKTTLEVQADYIYTKDGCVQFRGLGNTINFLVRVEDIIEIVEQPK